MQEIPSNKDMSCILRNTDYFFLTPGNEDQLVGLQRKLFTYRRGLLIDAAKWAFQTHKSSYLCIDRKPDTPVDLKLRIGMLPSETGMVLQPVT